MSTNEIQQFDQFENINSSKNFHAFDFAHSSANIMDNTKSSIWFIKDKLTQLNNNTLLTNDTGIRNIIFGDPSPDNKYSPIYTGTTSGSMISGKELTSLFPLQADNGPDKTVPVIEDNVLIYLNKSTQEFRSGYIEISFKTNKQNCILGYGSSIINFEEVYLPNSTVIDTTKTGHRKTIENPSVSNIYNNQFITEDIAADTNEIIFGIKDGKLNIKYNDKYGIDANSFELTGNITVANDQWHHVVINFTRPGMTNSHAHKTKEKEIEFWVDGKLDKKFTNILNDQIFLPTISWLGYNPTEILNKVEMNNFYKSFMFNDENNIALNKLSNKIYSGAWGYVDTTNSFNGSIRTFANGVNIPLNKFEIAERYKYWSYDETAFRDSLTASAKMSTPIVSVNKKRALKLFWNNIENKNGIELDNNFIIDSLCVTHKNNNSVTETYNMDLARNKTFNTLPDVRIAIKSNVPLWGPSARNTSTNTSNGNNLSDFTFANTLFNLTFSGVELNVNDRILLTNQINKSENGIWVFNGKGASLTRPSDADSVTKINNSMVYVTEGYESQTYWILESNLESLNDPQQWTRLHSEPEDTIYAQPFFGSRWQNADGTERFIDLQQDINIANYDLIVFMNYPDTFTDIKTSADMESSFDIKKMYDNFIKSIKNVVVEGSSLYISAPLLATDLGIVDKFTSVPQLTEAHDKQSAMINPFQVGEDKSKYFDTHRNNRYILTTEVAGLTNKNTYVLSDFINYKNEEITEYHAKYLNRPEGLKQGNEFIIPGLALISSTENENLPGFRANYKGTKPINAVAPNDINSGTVVTQLANNYYVEDMPTTNPYDDYATTIILQSGDFIGNTQISGKVFMNCVEDGYTFSRQDYNKAFIQSLPQNDINENNQTRQWQYSTNRLNRLPRRINIRQLTKYGQTKPTSGGGGGFIQGPSNSSNGIVRSQKDSLNEDYQSDLYPTIEEEIYSVTEIPVLSMTWLGLKWLAE